MKIERFEDIEGWQYARRVANQVYALAQKGNFARDFGLRDQVQRAAVSIMANISEGFDSGSKSDFLRFLTYARRSTSEVQSHLYVAKDQSYISAEEFDNIYAMCVQTKNLIGGFIRYLSNRSTGEREHRRTHE